MNNIRDVLQKFNLTEVSKFTNIPIKDLKNYIIMNIELTNSDIQKIEEYIIKFK